MKAMLYGMLKTITLMQMAALSVVLMLIGGDTMARMTHHVVHNSNGGWDVKRGGGSKASCHFDKKADAVKAGRIISQNQHTEFCIHGLNGRIQSCDSHGKDPCPPKG